MAEEEVQEDQEKPEAKTAETENIDNPEEDMDSLMTEMDGTNSKSADFGGSGDLSSLVTDTVESNDENIDEMLDSASQSSFNEDMTSDDEEAISKESLPESLRVITASGSKVIVP